MAINIHGKSVDLKEYTLAVYKEGAAWLRDYVTAIKNGQFHPYTKLERKAREATRNEPWGPTGALLNELAQACYEISDCQIVFAVIQLRLGYPPAKWRNVYKGLTLLEFLLKRGPENCVRMAKSDLLYRLADLEGFQYVSPDGKDLGANVRLRAQAVHALVKDERRLREEREVFRSKRAQFSGFSRGEMLSGQGSAAVASSSLRRSRSDGGDASSYTNYTGSGASSVVGEVTPQSKLQSASRGAGEMKGVSMEENKKQLVALKALLERPENRSCADCSGGGAASRATWASINTGAFICMRCAGVHRGLGVHISKVRSCTLDTWLPEQVAFMARTGNARANAHYEARLPAGAKPSYYSPELEAFTRRKYNGEYAKEGEDWPPAEAFGDPDTEQRPSTAPSQEAASPSPLRLTAALPSPEEGFGESAFAGPPPLQRAPSAPNLMDFGADTPRPSLSNTCAANPSSSAISIHAGKQNGAVGMDEFELLMAASARPNLLDDHEATSMSLGDAMTPEPVMEHSHMTALGLTPPRSLLSSFHAAAQTGPSQNGTSSAAAADFGPPTDFNAPSGSRTFSSVAPAPSMPTGTTNGFRTEPAAGCVHPGSSMDMSSQQHLAHSASHGTYAAHPSPSGSVPFRSTSAQELSFEGEPAPRWELATACQPPPAGAIYSADFSAATRDVLQTHLQPLPTLPRSAIAPLPKAASRPYRPPGIPGSARAAPGPESGASNSMPGQAQQAGPAQDAWYAQAGALSSAPGAQQPPVPGAQQAPLNTRALPKVGGPRRGASDPSGYVMEDLLAHAVDNMRIKKAGRTQLARRAEAPAPSLLEQKMGARIGAAKG